MQSSTSLPGARIGKYHIVALIATGGMGRVYKAKDEQLGRTVALKILAPDLARNPILVERFRREARHAACLKHKNIVTLFEADEADGFHYLAMEFIQGVDLAEYIRRKGKLNPEEARRILIQACKALEHAFGVGITHRDIKPSNFLLANEDGHCRVKLTDLGLSRMENDEQFRVTQAGCTVGTVDYMAPEQARDSSQADIRSDIYSLGCTLYHMLAGNPPFSEGGIGERVYKHLSVDPTDVRQFNPNVSAGLWTVLRRMMAKHPEDRFQTPTELIQSLRSIPAVLPEQPAESLPEDKESAPEPKRIRVPKGSEDPDPSVDSDAVLKALSEPETTTPTAPPSSPPKSSPRPASTPGERRFPTPTTTPARRPLTTHTDLKTTPDADPLGITAEQRQNASSQYLRAMEVIGGGGGGTYAVQLLLTCLKLDPLNILYRRMLRETVRDESDGKRAGWFGALSRLPARNRLRSSLRAGEFRKVLEDGEEFLTRYPGDVPTQLDMAQAAEALGLTDLGVWILEQARGEDIENVEVLRALANCYGAAKRYPQAGAIWEQIRKLLPDDNEAQSKIKEMAVADTITRSHFKR